MPKNINNYKGDTKIKLLVVIDYIWGIRGGTETQVSLLLKNLDRNKYEIYLICLRNSDWLEKSGSVLNCKIKAFNIKAKLNPTIIISFFRLIQYIKKIKPDIVITFFRESNIIGVIAAKLAGTKQIVSTRRDYGLWLQSRGYRFLILANKFVKGIVTNSEKVKELTSKEEKFDASKIKVIYNGLQYDGYKTNPDENRRLKRELGILENNKIVGIIANLRPMKRYHTFINAANYVLEKNRKVDFVIIGDGLLRKELEMLTEELGISKLVHFAGSREDVLPYLSIFDIGVNCSANEGLSNAIMEYMAYGVPCIVSRSGGNEELIMNDVNGYTFELDNHEELGNLIIDLLSNSRLQRDFTIKSKRKILRQLNIENMVDAYDSYFSGILAI